MNFGNADADGANVNRWTPDNANGNLGVAFSRSLGNLKIESCNFGDLEYRVRSLEDKMDKISKFLVIE